MRNLFLGILMVLLSTAAPAASTGVSEKFLKVEEGVTVRYLESGGSDLPLLLMLHGNPETAETWLPLMPTLSKYRHVVAMDLAGVHPGYRPSLLKKYYVDEMNRIILKFVAALGHRKFSVVGHDIGGGVAWTLAIKKPKYLDKLIITNAPHPYIFASVYKDANSAQYQMSDYMRKIKARVWDRFYFQDEDFQGLQDIVFNYPENHLNAHYADLKNRQDLRRRWNDPGTIDAYLNFYKAHEVPAFSPNFFTRFLSTVKVPTLVVWGEKDPYLVVENATRLQEVVKKLCLSFYPKASHWVHHEYADKVAQDIVEFLEINSVSQCFQ